MPDITSLFIVVPQLIGGVQLTNPLFQFGEIGLLVFATGLIAIFGFLFAAIFIDLYTRKFYVGETPKGWKVFFSGLLLSFIYQIMKVPFTYRWIYGDIFTLIFLGFQILAIGVLVYGLYLLKKEVQIV